MADDVKTESFTAIIRRHYKAGWLTHLEMSVELGLMTSTEAAIEAKRLGRRARVPKPTAEWNKIRNFQAAVHAMDLMTDADRLLLTASDVKTFLL